MDYYNGFSPAQRFRKLREPHKEFPNRSHPYYKGPCHMCGDPSSPVAPHSEDYSAEHDCDWKRPAMYALCRTCHGHLHKRFNSPFSWEAYKRHLRRGGFGSDLKKPPIAREISALARALEADRPFELSRLRPAPDQSAWWESLTTDTASVTGALPRKH